MLAALTVSGLPTDRFLFAGFAPPGAAARLRFLEDLATERATVVLYESPKRVNRIFAEMADAFGIERRAVICRELTKRYEEVVRGTVGELVTWLDGRALRGEVVIVIDRAPDRIVDEADLVQALHDALGVKSLKDAVAEVADQTGLPRRTVYQAALKLGEAE